MKELNEETGGIKRWKEGRTVSCFLFCVAVIDVWVDGCVDGWINGCKMGNGGYDVDDGCCCEVYHGLVVALASVPMVRCFGLGRRCK